MKQKLPRPFSRAASIDYATLALMREPTRKFIARVEPVGAHVATFVLPSKLCLTANQKKGMHWRAISRVKSDLLSMMFAQNRFQKRTSTLVGRPQVLATRFTSSRPDKGAGWEKDIIDALLTDKVKLTKNGSQVRRGLGFIADDSDLHIDAHAWWEAGPKDGFVLLRVFAGGEA